MVTQLRLKFIWLVGFKGLTNLRSPTSMCERTVGLFSWSTAFSKSEVPFTISNNAINTACAAPNASYQLLFLRVLSPVARLMYYLLLSAKKS